jgi:diphthamide synthase (EF-2-diphthine--ammonia ligase)
MTRFVLHPPERTPEGLALSWETRPASDLYRRTSCRLRFPGGLDWDKIPAGLAERIAILLLHGQWTVLSPVRVELPFALPAGELEAWRRLMESYWNTLVAHRPDRIQPPPFEAELISGPAPLPVPVRLPDLGRCATSFSGGKDSLFQAGFLRAAGFAPLLVATTSPMPPLEDHLHPRRRWLLDAIAREDGFKLIEAQSDFRSCWDNEYALRRGFKSGINEITDTFLYTGAMMLGAAARGVTHLSLASENEVQDTVEREGVVLQHPHAMYSVVTLQAIEGLFAPFGLRLGSLTASLQSGQVQRMLWREHPALRKYQFSCWSVRGTDPMCNACAQCLRITLNVLADGRDPSEMGADLQKLLNTLGGWRPRAAGECTADALPSVRVSSRLHRQVMQDIRRLSSARVASYLWRRNPAGPASGDWRRAFAAWRRLRRIAADYPPPPDDMSYADDFLDSADPRVRDALQRHIEAHFRPARSKEQTENRARGRKLTEWILEPLGGGTRPDPRPAG